MQVTNAIIWTICISIIVFICILWMIICYIGVCKIRRKNKKNKLLPVYGSHGYGTAYLNGYNIFGNSYSKGYSGNGKNYHNIGGDLNPNYLHGYTKHPTNGYTSSHSTSNNGGE